MLKRENLHRYQLFVVDYILNHPNAAIFLDCGLGKTVISLTAIDELMYDSFEIGKVLVICPLRVGEVWVSEVKKWEHLRHLRISRSVGTEKERLAALKADADIYVINRENIPWLVEKSGLQFDYDMLVVDELSSFKNWKAKRFKALMKVRPLAKRVVGLTGTPTGSGGYMSLFAEMMVIDLGRRLGRFIGQYKSCYFRPLATNGQIVYSYGLLPGAEDIINRKISDITISMSAVDNLDMPEKNVVEYPVRLDDRERKVYERMKNDLVIQTKEGEVTAANAAALSGKLCQLSSGAVYRDDGTVAEIHDRKLDALEDIIEAAVGRQVIVVYYFRHERDRIAARLKEMKADFDFIDSDESIRRWNRGEYQVCLLHPMSAGHGLNLQESGCNLMVFVSTPFSVEAYQQTVGRIYRQGQKSRKVTIMHIMAEDTIDSRIMKALERGSTTQAALIEAVRAQIGGDA
ncbi:MAG: DEAD/DEAH box helicase [Lachnospiraceae bacterium]|nr:DEAD/DEAH box helicase [Lachnospiraceae bacterium]